MTLRDLPVASSMQRLNVKSIPAAYSKQCHNKKLKTIPIYSAHLTAIYSNHQATKKKAQRKYLAALSAFGHKDISCDKKNFN
jgi:hypothetical protein